MKKGLRPWTQNHINVSTIIRSKPRPDEEGIETMATGTRRELLHWYGSKPRPDEEGIETGQEKQFRQNHTALRSKPRPDEEGIET